GGVELCDFLDNDCDGAIDETTDSSTDPNNCGQCGRVCDFPHADPRCKLGTCGFDPATDCDPGFHDADHTQLNGCEYACTPSTNPTEVCNGKDDDCNGKVDDGAVGTGVTCSVGPGGVPVGECTATGTTTCVAG